MIRAGRRQFVRTLADLAAQRGVSPRTLSRSGHHQAEGHPAPISSPRARTLLWDGEQTDAYLAGRPVPELPAGDDDQDLLDRREAADVLGIDPRTWDTYKSHPVLAEAVTVVGGVEHWPRAAVHRYRSRDEQPTTESRGSVGRQTGTGDQVPRDQLPALVTELLDADPATSAADVTAALGASRNAAQEALTRVRAERIADQAERTGQTPTDAATALHYPAGLSRRACLRAQTLLRGRALTPYLTSISRAVHAAGWTTTAAPPDVRLPADDVLVAVLVLDAGQAPAPALVWDERYGWRTAASRRHPIARGAALPPEGDGVRYLADGTTPPPGDVVAALTP